MTSAPQQSREAADPAVEAELERLPMTPIAICESDTVNCFRTEPPKAFGPDLLRRSIAHRIQERAYGGLSASSRRLLDQLVKAAMAKPNGRLDFPADHSRAPNLCGPGIADLTAYGPGERFAYDGRRLPASEIASHITGTRWNGPRFFGLRSSSSRESTDGQ